MEIIVAKTLPPSGRHPINASTVRNRREPGRRLWLWYFSNAPRLLLTGRRRRICWDLVYVGCRSPGKLINVGRQATAVFQASETVAQEPMGAGGGQLCALACQSEATATGKRQAKRAIGSCRYCGLDNPQPLRASATASALSAPATSSHCSTGVRQVLSNKIVVTQGCGDDYRPLWFGETIGHLGKVD